MCSSAFIAVISFLSPVYFYGCEQDASRTSDKHLPLTAYFLSQFLCFFFTFHIFFEIIYVLLWRVHKKDIWVRKEKTNVTYLP